jgi:hypothetical protein
MADGKTQAARQQFLVSELSQFVRAIPRMDAENALLDG